MTALAVTVLGHDRPGIIAETTAALADLGLNLEDSTMTLLRGHFAFMLICAGDVDRDAVAEELVSLTSDGLLDVSVREVQPEPEVAPTGTAYQLAVHGGDRAGIVSALTEVIGKGKAAARKIKHANVLLKLDADGPGWSDAQAADAFECRLDILA